MKRQADNTAALIPALAAQLWNTRIDAIPPQVVQQAKLCLLDTLGAIVVGARTPDWKPLFEVERRIAPQRESTVLATGQKIGMISAARVNAYLGDIFELNDMSGGHGSIGNVSALLAVAEAQGASGARLIEAIAIGLEATMRVYAAYRSDMKQFTDVGLNPVSINAAMGVAAGTAHLLGLVLERTTEAIAIGATIAGWSPAEAIFGEGGSAKPMLFGTGPAAAGIAAALYAQAGMTGPHRLLEGTRGLFVTIARQSKPEVLTQPGWLLEHPRRKIHACCGYTHAPIDLVVRMRGEGAPFAQARRIVVDVGAHTVGTVSKPAAPIDGNDARFHLQYVVALAAAGADIILPEHSLDPDRYAQDPAVRALLERVEVRANPQFRHFEQCAIALLDANGAVLAQAEAAGSRGSPQQPLLDADMRAKFRRLVSHCMDERAVDGYLAKFDTLEHSTHWSWLVEAFAQTAQQPAREPLARTAA